MPYVRQAEIQDIAPIAKHLKESHLREMAASGNTDAYRGLRLGFSVSVPHAMTACREDGTPFSMFGIQPLDDPQGRHTGNVWMLSTDDIYKHAAFMLRTFRDFVEAERAHYRYLWNTVWVENHESLRWLQRTGWDTEAADLTINNNQFKLALIDGI